MATHDYVIANASGAAVRSDLNNALAAIVSNNSNTTEPATTYAYQSWADTTAGLMKIRNSTNDAWVSLFNLDGSSLGPGKVTFGATEVVFNDAGDDVDFRIEGDTEANLFFVDASTDRVGIGTTSPVTVLDIRNASDANLQLRSEAGTDRALVLSANNGDGPYLGTTTAHDLRIFAGNAEKVRLDTSGRLLVGTTSSSGSNALVVQGNSLGANQQGVVVIASDKSTFSSGDNYGTLSFSDNTHARTASIEAVVDGTFTAGSFRPARLVFSTTPTTASSPTERMRIEASGAARHVASSFASFARTDTATTNLIFVQFARSATSPISYTSEGDIRTDSSGNIALANASDITLKENIRDLEGCLDSINALHPVLFDWKQEYKECCTDVKGFIAQEFEQVLPKSVSTGEDGIKSIAPTSELFPLLVGAIQELSATVQILQAEVAALKGA